MTIELRWLRPGEARSRFLTHDERSRAASFVHTADRDRFVAGRFALRVLVGRLLDCAPADVTIATQARGKPVVAGPSRLEVGVAHAGDMVLVGASSSPFGIDVEPPPPLTTVAQVAPHVCSPEELHELEASQPGDRSLAFARMWVRKEAVVKADGAGLAMPLADLRVGTGRQPPEGQVAGWHVRDLRIPGGVPAAVAVARADDVVGLARFVPGSSGSTGCPAAPGRARSR